ncbi:Amiloride-sensitive sodium channel [Nesidiocoris tenuis]|uniref:Amiloride-sensitive sodium channel n=1 Tax=Nesidiocoris tenuis TaxID=355587 RepID=A0ABN7BH87_9HEMI|nr:Amiloride-sensitive sodium channel [Nesidiocoris tenuis]
MPHKLPNRRFGDVDNRSEAIDWLDALARANFKSFDQLAIDDRISPSDYLQVLTEARYKLKYAVSDSNSNTGDLTFTITEGGLCYTYNSAVALYNSPGYWANGSRNLDTSISIFKGSPLDGDVFAQVMDLNSGYTAYIHSPYEIPDASTPSHTSLENLYLSIDITALSTESSNEIKVLPIARRKCRFMEESNLKSSPVYSYNHCRSECRMALAFKLCRCVPYFYRPMGYPTCGIEGMKCLGRHKERLIKLQEGLVKEDCACLPPCNNVVYNVYSSGSTPWYLGTNLKFGLLKYPRTRLKRDLLFTGSDLLVQLGGSASLCLGCSILSFCELVYLFTLRLFLFIRGRR